MRILRAVGAGFTAFVNELSPYDFPLLGDGLCDDCSLSWPAEDSSVGASASAAAEERPEAVPPLPASGHPDPAVCAVAAQQLRRTEWPTQRSHAYWNFIADELTK